MAYVYEVSFGIARDHAGDLQIGGPVQRVLGYLRTLLPSEPGFVTARAMMSAEPAATVEVVFQSVWEEWGDLLAHRQTGRSEAKVLTEFQPHLARDALSVLAYEDVP